MTSKGAIFLHEAFMAHVLECGLLRYYKNDLRKLSRKQKTRRMGECVFRGFNIDVPKEWESFNISVLVHCVVIHVRVPLTNSLTLDADEGIVFSLGLSFTISTIEKP